MPLTDPTAAPGSAGRFDPDGVTCFRYVDRTFDWARYEAVFTYALDHRDGSVTTCTERYAFPAPALVPEGARRDAVLRVLDHLFLAAGLSYFKLAAPAAIEIEVGAWSPEEISFHRVLLARGLGEYCFVNGLDPELRPTYRYTAVGASAGKPVLTGLGLDAGALVPVGGGKDSCVTIEALRAAGRKQTLVTVNRYPVIQDVIDASGLPDLHVRRTLDPGLGALNAAGARNGHVPATAIVSFAVLVCALLHGADAVVMSNERSASEGNVSYRGTEINHQWSKSDEAEAMLQSLLASITPELRWFSLLRPLSELAIAQRFGRTCARYLDVFSSCNGAFRLDPSRRVGRWCGTCPKCQFVFLALASVVDRPTVERIWGEDLFSTSPVSGFDALLGLGEWKPFECVGESGECRVALQMISAQMEWTDHPVVRALMGRVAAAGLTPGESERTALFVPGPARVPADWHGVLGAS